MDPRIMFSLSLTLRDSVLSFLAFFNLLSGKNAWILMKKICHIEVPGINK